MNDIEACLAASKALLEHGNAILALPKDGPLRVSLMSTMERGLCVSMHDTQALGEISVQILNLVGLFKAGTK